MFIFVKIVPMLFFVTIYDYYGSLTLREGGLILVSREKVLLKIRRGGCGAKDCSRVFFVGNQRF